MSSGTFYSRSSFSGLEWESPLFWRKRLIHGMCLVAWRRNIVSDSFLPCELNAVPLFDLLKKGNPFDAQTVRHLDSAGKWWITFWVFEVFYYEIGRYCGIGCGILQISDVLNFGSLFAGLVLILVAWLLREAQGLEEE